MVSDSTRAPGEKAWRVPPWAWVPIGIAVGAEATVNALRAYGLGAHLERYSINALGQTVSLAGAVLVFAAVAVSLAQARAAWVAFQPGAMARQRAIGIPLTVLLLAVSVSAMSVTLFEAQRAKSADEGGARARYDRAQAAYEAAQAEFEGLESIRTPEAIKAAMEAAPVSRRVFRVTAECTDITKESSFDACKPILALRQEMAQAIRRRELSAVLPGLKAELDGLARPEQASATEMTAADVWGWLMGLAVVLVATFGSVIFAVPSMSGANRPNRPNDPPGQSDLQPERQMDGLKADVLAHIQGELTEGRCVPSNVALVSLFGGKRSTMSDWLIDFERAGLIPARRTVGRCKVIAAR